MVSRRQPGMAPNIREPARPVRRGWRGLPPRRVRKMKVVLVPLDGSELAARAVPFATAIAARSGWSLLLLRAVNTLSAPTDTVGLALKQEAQEALDAVAASLAASTGKRRRRSLRPRPMRTLASSSCRPMDVGALDASFTAALPTRCFAMRLCRS